MQRLSFRFHDRHHTGDLMSRAIVDVEAVRMFINMGLVRTPYYVALFIAVAALLLLLLADPEELFAFAGIYRYLVAVAIGLLAGFLSGLLGVGGGIFVVPTTVFFLSMEQRDAQAFALAMMIPTSVAGTVAHTRLGNVRWRWAVGIALFSVPTGLIFGTLAGGWIDQQILRYVFVALLIYFSLRMFGTVTWLRKRVARSE